MGLSPYALAIGAAAALLAGCDVANTTPSGSLFGLGLLLVFAALFFGEARYSYPPRAWLTQTTLQERPWLYRVANIISPPEKRILPTNCFYIGTFCCALSLALAVFWLFAMVHGTTR